MLYASRCNNTFRSTKLALLATMCRAEHSKKPRNNVQTVSIVKPNKITFSQSHNAFQIVPPYRIATHPPDHPLTIYLHIRRNRGTAPLERPLICYQSLNCYSPEMLWLRSSAHMKPLDCILVGSLMALIDSHENTDHCMLSNLCQISRSLCPACWRLKFLGGFYLGEGKLLSLCSPLLRCAPWRRGGLGCSTRCINIGSRVTWNVAVLSIRYRGRQVLRSL